MAILALFASSLATASTSQARPHNSTSYQQQTITAKKKAVKVKKTKRTHVRSKRAVKPRTATRPRVQQAAIVQPNRNPVINNRCQFLFWEVECVQQQEDTARAFGVTEPEATPRTTTRRTAKRNNNWDNSQPVVFGFRDHVAKAESMIGMDARSHRRELSSKFQRTIGLKVDPARIPWCAAWANTVLAESGMATTGSLMARSFINWGRPTANPRKGDVVVLTRGKNRRAGHVGFFYGFVDDNGVRKVAVLGGNQGKAVNITYFPVSQVIAYRTS